MLIQVDGNFSFPKRFILGIDMKRGHLLSTSLQGGKIRFLKYIEDKPPSHYFKFFKVVIMTVGWDNNVLGWYQYTTTDRT